MRRGRRRSALLLLLLAVVVNLPLVHSAWTDLRLDRSGTEVTAEVTGHRVSGDQHWVSFTFPERIDPQHRTWRAEVEGSTYDDAVESGSLRVRVLEDDPAAYQVHGQAGSRLPLVATLIADAVLVLMAVLMLRYGGRTRARLTAVALEDVRRCAPETRLERLVAEDYLIRGEVVEVADDRVVLDVGNRTVEVLLGRHHNRVGHQQPAEVRARLTS